MPSFYSRPVFFVSNAPRAVRFYVDVLGFDLAWDRSDVAQVNRGDLELILAEDPGRAGQGRLFVELMPDELVAFRTEVTTRPIPTTDLHWGYPCWQIRDPDQNELLVCQENDPEP
jgi:catechol 2,3-dioxygenase-like lactoylglutathione lyase family enzyme